MKVLNLYAGIGGNRKLWGDHLEVTAVEWDAELASIYQEYFPNDKVVVADAHEYLLQHYKEFDFIWSSPPCQSHSDIRRMGVKSGQNVALYPDMKLYEEILFLSEYFDGKWVVENVEPFYTPLIRPVMVDRHCFWANFHILPKRFQLETPIKEVTSTTKHFGFDLSNRKMKHRKDQVLRNCVNPALGLHVLNCSLREEQMTLCTDNGNYPNKKEVD